MSKDISYKLPPIYRRNNRDCYLDPIRKKLIYITPEETVRQQMISYLKDYLDVPAEMMLVEEPLAHYGLESRRRADIVVHKLNQDNLMEPVVIIECKAPEISLNEKAFNQLADYCDMLVVNYAVLYNGRELWCYHYDEKLGQYVVIETLPSYKDILAGQHKTMDIEELLPRKPFEELSSEVQHKCVEFQEDDVKNILTPMELVVPVFNLWEGLMDTRVKMPTGNYGLFTLTEDYGVRWLSYGNASGMGYTGSYRSFLVNIDGSDEFFSIGVYGPWNTPHFPATYICVAHDDEKSSHHALQLSVEDNLIRVGDRIDFYHSGRIAVGKKGSGKIDELRMFVASEYPKIISGNKFYLGSLVHDRLWRLDDPAVIEVIVNLISYSIVRDEYRDFVKNNK